MLDYAANSTAYWQRGQLFASFRLTCLDADKKLEQFLRGKDPIQFWETAERNLRNGEIRLIFVADKIPSELARVVEFLNEQMTADVRAVELGWFESGKGELTLVPRHIGGSDLTEARKNATKSITKLSVEAWIKEFQASGNNELARAAEEFVRVINALGGNVEAGRSDGSLIARFDDIYGRGVYPIH